MRLYNLNPNSVKMVKIVESVKWASVVLLSSLFGSGATLGFTALMNIQVIQANKPAITTPNVNSNLNLNVNEAIPQIAKEVEPDVVAVINYTTSNNFFNQKSRTQESDIGSGVYFSKDAQYAYIVTNNHVVEGETKVEVVLQSGHHVNAQVVGTDPFTDLAVIKTSISNFNGVQPALFANSNDIQVGEPAIAIGTPMGLDFTESVTSGIVSGKERMMPVEEPNSQQILTYQAVLQTDAAINPGNSGGPLLNIVGQVIGINSSKIAEQDVSGMGFAIPSDEVLVIASEIMKTGHAVHPALGIDGYSLSAVPQQFWPDVPVDYGVYIESVISSAAKKAGLRHGDVIVSMDGHPVRGTADLRTELFETKPGQQVKLGLYRSGKKINITVKIVKESSINTTANRSNNTN